MFFKIGALKNFAIFAVTELSLFLIKAFRAATLLKRDYNTGVSL